MFEVGPTFSDITTTALIDGEDVVELFMRLNDLPDLEGFEDFMENHCNLLNDMHDAFESKYLPGLETPVTGLCRVFVSS